MGQELEVLRQGGDGAEEPFAPGPTQHALEAVQAQMALALERMAQAAAEAEAREAGTNALPTWHDPPHPHPYLILLPLQSLQS